MYTLCFRVWGLGAKGQQVGTGSLGTLVLTRISLRDLTSSHPLTTAQKERWERPPRRKEGPTHSAIKGT